jgi:signal recognition particle receptor subunit beta
VGSLKEEIAVVVVSYSGKEINAKLVYYGAGLSGKTTNLESIYEAVPDASRGKMVSMKTQSDRTLFFDLLPLDLGEIMGFKTRFLLYTVPGQVFYNATRKLVLKGADAIVFVADSEVGKMEENKESLGNLRANLAEYGVELDATPWVIQYNKRDLPNVYSVEELNAELNPGGKVPFFEAVATQGKGVFETFRGISHLLMEKVTKDLRRGGGPKVGNAPGTGPAAAAAEPPAPARHPSSAPPATSPARAIQQESRHADPEGQAKGGVLDYGREIELPDTIPPQAEPPRAPSRSAPPEPAVVGNPEPRGRAAERVEHTRPEPVARPEPKPAAPSRAARSAEPLEPPAPRASAPAASARAAAAETVTVPVRIPKGGTREIVLRIVIQNEE